jgi:hypothetical protein
MTGWHADDNATVSSFLSQNGVAVAPRAKEGAGIAGKQSSPHPQDPHPILIILTSSSPDLVTGIARAKQHASRLANSDSAKRAREVTAQKSARAKEAARVKREEVQASEKYQKASAAATEWGQSADT